MMGSATTNAWEVVLDPVTGGGCSTLDLLKRIPYEIASEPSPFVSDAVRHEMLVIAQSKQQQHELKRLNHTTNVPRQVANMATLGELLDRPKEKYVPGTPVVRTLKGGRFLRNGGRDEELHSSWSAPALPTHTRKSSKLSGDHDALDHVVQQQVSPVVIQKGMTVLMEPEDPRTVALREQRQQLEQRLLHVTQKLCRKYTQQLFPRPTHGGSPDKMAALAEKWSHSDTMTEPEKYKLFMGSRFSTQQQRDFYTRELEPREPDRDRHRRETQHTKYGNALVKSKHSLRANF